MKYMGSKARFSKELIPIITANLGDRPYVEPFAGGFNLICDVSAVGGRYANEYHKYIVAAFEAMLRGWIPRDNYTKEEYQSFKRLEGDDHEIGYVGINASFGGKWFGGFANPKNGRNYQHEAKRHMLAQVKKLNGIYTRAGSYIDMPIPGPSCVIYCDPPYAGTTDYKMGKFDAPQFWGWVRDINKQHEVFVSEYAAPDDFTCIWEKTNNVTMNSSKRGTIRAVEKLFKLL